MVAWKWVKNPDLLGVLVPNQLQDYRMHVTVWEMVPIIVLSPNRFLRVCNKMLLVSLETPRFLLGVILQI